MRAKISFYITLILFVLVCLLPYRTSLNYFKKPLSEEIKTNLQPIDQRYLEKTPINFSRDSETVRIDIGIMAQAAIAIDVDSKRVLYEKNSEEKKPVASLVKMMTAILAREYLNLEDEAIVSSKAANTGENTMGLREGEKYIVEDLLYGLILNSGNDAAVVLAEKVAGEEGEFVQLMNSKAKLVGAEDTLFADSSGLNIDKSNYFSTAEDLAKIAYYSQTKHLDLKEIYKTTTWEIPSTKDHEYRFLENQTNLLTTYPGVMGMKTGYTEEAGLCLVSYAENDGKKVIIVVLNSVDRKGDAIILLDFAFKKLNVDIVHTLL